MKRFQRGAVPVLGIVDITFTVGDSEFLLMEQEQKINEKGGRRYFQPTERDLSRSYKRGSDGTRMPAQRCIMWICKESKRAQELLCRPYDLKIIPSSECETGGAGSSQYFTMSAAGLVHVRPGKQTRMSERA